MIAATNLSNPMSTSSTLWATASKEWVIQPKPKPGRKPKKDTPVAKPDEEPQLDNKGRRIQNRAAQRAFRERKQSQLAELQARVQSYEQGEIERNVALQNIAKRLKEENEALRLENSLLKEKILKAGQNQAISSENEKKRWRDDSPSSNSANKRSKSSPDSPKSKPTAPVLSYIPSPPSMVSSPDSNGSSETRCSPLPYELPADQNHSPLSNLLEFPSTVKPAHLDGNGFPPFDCGFCSEDTPCVCREFVEQQVHDAERALDFNVSNEYNQPNVNSVLQVTNIIHLESAPAPPQVTSILENLPAYQPPVPLRRRPAPSNVNTIFAVAPPSVPPPAPANCSGDPSNCPACADDAFGKAFCSAIEESVAAQSCNDCSSQGESSNNPGLHIDCCGSSGNCTCRSSAPSYSTQMEPETMPTNDAWRQIKSHPNVAFADLALLADVVARRSKCTGPRVVISPALGSITPERTVSPGIADDEPNQQSEPGTVLLIDPHAHYREKERSRSDGASTPPRLIPQEVLIRCGRQRVREVHTDSVRAALRLLDAKFT
ncbi:hypothetical protein Hypma_015420 [Hypsizygus marmoreus]|uniref:BZIP domain-containing protein n=1 Tax=Hypsizygus marmoreus TaxID=39966 RepID=A0A369K6H5_HYPMA|nr:hypothetical protein Hypma_015420 [Hypsizygus marmoreus]